MTKQDLIQDIKDAMADLREDGSAEQYESVYFTLANVLEYLEAQQ